MEKSEIEARIKKVIAKVLQIDEAQVNPEANFIFDLGADSMQSVQLVAAFEEEFGVELDQDGALEVQTVCNAVDFIETAV